ncbi:MAG: tetratricopeptide repeat protein, partial [Ilumatobacter sp.]|nr:tetratricopeptide repeat protein [Ilumatobacter sp.]
PEDVVDTITRRSGGNPLFLIELARLAASSSDDDVDAGRLPGTMRALIAARLDQLTPSQRQVLDNAAIIGTTGDVESLEEFAAELGQWFDPDAIEAIEATGMMTCDDGHWHFRSDVVREVAYHTLTKLARAQRHAGVARYLENFEPGLVDRRAHHTAAAAELVCELGPVPGVPDAIQAEAVQLLASAARSWIDQGAYRRAIQLIERGLCIGVDDPQLHADLLLRRAEALVDLRDMRPARARATELIEFADEAGDRVLRAEAMRLLGTIEQSDGDLVAAREHLKQAVDEFRDIGDPLLLADGLRARGFGEVFGGSLSDADRFLREAEALFASGGDARGVAWVQQHRAWVSFLAGDHAESEARLTTAIDTFHALNDRAGIAWSMGLLGYVYHFTRRDDEALAMASEVLEEARQWGDDWGLAMMYNLQAGIWLWRGRLDDACAAAERALAVFRRIDDRFGIIQALSTLSRTYVALGRFSDAQRSVEEVMVLSGSFGELAYPVVAAAGTAMHLGDGRRAAELAEQAVERLDTTGANVEEAHVMMAFGALLDGDADETLARLLDVDIDGSPFALAARATAHATIGDRESALADADAVAAMPSISYWDRTIALVAGAAAGHGDVGEALRRREALREQVESVDDVIVTSYATAVLHALDGDDGPPPHSAVGGWAALAERLVAGRPTAAGAMRPS